MLSYIHVATVHMHLDFHVWIFWMIHDSEDKSPKTFFKIFNFKKLKYIVMVSGTYLCLYSRTSLFIEAAEAPVAF